MLSCSLDLRLGVCPLQAVVHLRAAAAGLAPLAQSVPLRGGGRSKDRQSASCRTNGKWAWKASTGPTSTTGGNAKGANCTCPYQYSGKQYSTCITTGNNGLLWCGTTSSSYDADKRWGNCETSSADFNSGFICGTTGQASSQNGDNTISDNLVAPMAAVGGILLLVVAVLLLVKSMCMSKQSTDGSLSGGRAGSNLEYEGNRNYTQIFYVASFPGIYEDVWKRMTEGAHALVCACACVFFQDAAGGVHGKHVMDQRGCWCDFCAMCAPNQFRPQIGTTFMDQENKEQQGDWDKNRPPWGCRWMKMWESLGNTGSRTWRCSTVVAKRQSSCTRPLAPSEKLRVACTWASATHNAPRCSS